MGPEGRRKAPPVAERLADIEGRISSVRQLSAVVTAMRGIAAARTHEANARLDGIRAYARTIGTAIAQALALQPEDEDPPAHRGQDCPPRHLIVAVASEQGFVGGYNSHVLDAAVRYGAGQGDGRADLFLIGDRGAMTAAERDLAVACSLPMAGHVDQVASLANRLADALFDRLERGLADRVTLLHAVPGGGIGTEIVEKTLIPFDYARFPPVSRAQPPLLTLPPAALLTRLADEYMFAELCEALTLGYAAENEARMRAMVAARDNVGRTLEELTARARQLRQDQITEEVVELATATISGSDPA